jgi:hypothetical protein
MSFPASSKATSTERVSVRTEEAEEKVLLLVTGEGNRPSAAKAGLIAKHLRTI